MPVSARAMTQDEVTDFLSRNSDAWIKVTEWNALASVLGYDQSVQWDPLSLSFGIPGPIPPAGLKYADPKYGTVIIFPDANASLHYTAVGGEVPGGLADNPTPSALSTILPKLPSLSGITYTTIIVALVVLGAVILLDRKL